MAWLSEAAIGSLCLSPVLWEQMRAEVQHALPEEACGLVAGVRQPGGYQALEVIPVTNTLHSEVRYRMEPLEQLAAFDRIDAQGWELVAIYHSHPAGPEQPSPSDIAESYYPDTIYLIWSKAGGAWQCRGFIIRDGQAHPVVVLVE